MITIKIGRLMIGNGLFVLCWRKSDKYVEFKAFNFILVLGVNYAALFNHNKYDENGLAKTTIFWSRK